MKKVIKADELQAYVNAANTLTDMHGVHYAFSVNKPLAGESYSLAHDGHVILTGTKKEIFTFLKTFIKVIKSEY